MPNSLAIVLAGGQGERLKPLTNERAKPAVPFGGHYRIIDFALSNLINSGFTRIKVLTQFKADSLLQHMKLGWYLPPMLDQFIDAVPAQMRTGESWYKGSADAVFQNLHHVENANADTVLVFGGDHIYRMDVRQMLSFHTTNNADITVAALPQPLDIAKEFGVITRDETGRMMGFLEKPKNPPPMRTNPSHALCSMGIYIFRADFLIKTVEDDARKENSSHDFGKDIIPHLFRTAKIMAYNFADNTVPGASEREKGYWRDVGSIDQYWHASMDLTSVSPIFNLYNNQWPIHTAPNMNPPAKFVFADEVSDRIGMATDSLVCDGVIISGGKINRSILSPGVRINSYSQVDESILFENVNIGRHSKIRRAIIDKDVDIPQNTIIGYDPAADRKRFTVSPEGIVVIPKRAIIPA